MAAGGIEINLPDLPEVPLRIGNEAPGPERRRRRRRLSLRDSLTAYLPLLLMVMLALGTWWLVKNTPAPAQPRATRILSGEPDYSMSGFSLQRFAPDGTLGVTLEGRQLHHYPESDRIEIESLKLVALAEAGRTTTATARKAVSNTRASEVRLEGGAQVRSRTEQGQDVEIDSEFLHYTAQPERVQTNRPVRVRVGPNLVHAGGMSYEWASRRLELLPPIRAELHRDAPRADAGGRGEAGPPGGQR